METLEKIWTRLIKCVIVWSWNVHIEKDGKGLNGSILSVALRQLEKKLNQSGYNDVLQRVGEKTYKYS